MDLNEKDQNFIHFQVGHSRDDKFLSDVVHKIKNNLGGIGGFASLLERDLDRNDPRKKLLQRIIDGVHRLNEFVIHLMTLVQKAEPSFEKIAIKSLIKEICYNFTKEDKDKEQVDVIHTDFPEEKMELSGDPYLMRELFYHAFRFTQLVGGQIESVKLNPPENSKIDIEIHFHDGMIPSDLLENIVHFIEECEPIEARLSLAVVYKIADLHNARISLETNSKDRHTLLIQLDEGN